MAAKSITRRWLLNTLSVTIGVLLLGGILFHFVMQNYYYSSARQVIMNKANVVSSTLLNIMTNDKSNFNSELRSIVESSAEKNVMEITAINHSGHIAISSSGFAYTDNENMEDYEKAAVSSNGQYMNISRGRNGEKIMSVSVMIPNLNAEFSAVRYSVSLVEVDNALLVFDAIYIVVAAGIIFLLIITGRYFIKSIVIPVREVGVAARKFATGDMTARIIKKSDDELGELTDIINHMADEISASENMKNDFISSVSHELRTPLTAIKGWSETLNTLEDTPENRATKKKGLKIINDETERLSLMVEELLDFSRLQNGKLTLVKAKMDILAEVGDAVLIYEERAKRDSIDFVYNEPAMLSPVYGDKNRLRQVFINVIDNAIKYSDPGGLVEVCAFEKDGMISISVKDNGCGISKVDLPKIKEKFYKANHSRRGSGIGLAVANEIVLMHGGSIDIKSELNKGTEIIINIPADKSQNEAALTVQKEDISKESVERKSDEE